MHPEPPSGGLRVQARCLRAYCAAARRYHNPVRHIHPLQSEARASAVHPEKAPPALSPSPRPGPQFHLKSPFLMIKINRKNQIIVCSCIIFDITRCFRIYQINIDFFIIDYSKNIHQKLWIKAN